MTSPVTEAPARVLIVDDEPYLLRSFQRMLVARGYAVTTVESAGEALDQLEGVDFDVVLSDIHLGDTTGVDLLEDARRRDCDVPFIMMTGLPDLSSAVRSIQHHAFRYLLKPFERPELEQAVSEAVSERRNTLAKRRALEEAANGDRSREAKAQSFLRALGSLFMAYQPIVRWSTRTVLAYEALLRTKEGSLPNPMAVLDAAHELGQMQELGRATRDRAAGDSARNPAELLFVNLHASDLSDELLSSTTSPLSTIAPRVVLEITERAALDEIADARARIDQLRALGFRIAIDDLGAGYSGLTSVCKLEPEVIKLDMSIVRGVERSIPNQRLIRSMVNVAKESSALLVAEGVETVEERDALVSLGCDVFQGYLFARPAPEFPAPRW